MKKLFWYGVISLTFYGVSAAATSGKEKVEVIYQIQSDGHWQVFLFGPHCPDNKALKVVPPDHYSAPIELDCEVN